MMYFDVLDLLPGDIVRISGRGNKEFRVERISITGQSCSLTCLSTNLFCTASKFDKIQLIARQQTLF